MIFIYKLYINNWVIWNALKNTTNFNIKDYIFNQIILISNVRNELYDSKFKHWLVTYIGKLLSKKIKHHYEINKS